MARFLDTHKMGPTTAEQLKELQKSPPDKFGVRHINMLYNYEANIMYCILEAPSKVAVEKHHSKLGYKCDWITELCLITYY
ncbi:MAG TPA: nickel-binding protein [Nitrososphaeraceae archaeon]|nr:nickel-binding protein [Nitrososphaeraceae archaeon]